MANWLQNLMAYALLKARSKPQETPNVMERAGQPNDQDPTLISNSQPPSNDRFKPIKNFIWGFPKNALFAIATTPFERLALERINQAIDKPHDKSFSYLKTIKALGARGLFAGANARTVYCLGGNLTTLVGISVFGDDIKGLFAGTICKNAIYPLYLWSNSKQRNYTRERTIENILAGIKNPMGHLAFCGRNGLANFCLLPGIYVRDYTYQNWGEKDELLPKVLGLFTSLSFSAFMNTVSKPLFTDIDKYTLEQRIGAAKRGSGLIALGFREAFSLGLIFFNTPAKKAEVKHEVDHSDNLKQHQPRKSGPQS